MFILKGIEQLEKAIAKAKKIRPRVEFVNSRVVGCRVAVFLQFVRLVIQTGQFAVDDAH